MLKHMDIVTTVFWIGLALTVLGMLLLMAGGASFQFRALSNKKPWDGHTRPLLRYGLITFIIGAIVFIPAVIHLYNAA